MSAATESLFYKSLNGQNVNRLRNFQMDPVTADPVVGEENQLKTHTGDNRVKWRDTGGTVHTLAHLTDLTSLWRGRGGMGTANALPTATDGTLHVNDPLRAYDAFMMTVASTITGIQGDDVLEVGDFLILIDEANPTTSASWVGIQTNTNDQTLPLVETVSQAVTADTAVVFNFTAIGNIQTYQVFAGITEITGDVVTLRASNNSVSVQSSIAITGVDVRAVGTIA